MQSTTHRVFGATMRNTRWSYSLLRDTSGILLDSSISAEDVSSIREALENGASGGIVADLHVWPLGHGKRGVIVSMVSDCPRSPDDYKKMLADRPEIAHPTVEVNRCTDHGGVAA